MRVPNMIRCSLLLPSLAVGALLSAKALSAQTIYDFNSPTAPTSSVCNNWGNVGNDPTHGPLRWQNAYTLNIPAYFNCWTNPPARTGYPVTGQVALLTSKPLEVRSVSGNPFLLSSLTVGSGWTNNVTLTLKGYSGSDASPIEQFTRTLPSLNARSASMSNAPTQWAIGGSGISWFTLSASFDVSGAPTWNPLDANCLYATAPGGNCSLPAWDKDPYDSRLYQWQVDRFNGMGPKARTDLPYQSVYISAFTVSTVVPEPSTYALMAAGLAALGIAARRRKRA